jgi:hypothetical protein
LKEILLSRKKDFARHLSGKMLSFALGRKLQYYDEPALQSITQTVIDNDYRATALITAVVQSYPFQHQNNQPPLENEE